MPSTLLAVGLLLAPPVGPVELAAAPIVDADPVTLGGAAIDPGDLDPGDPAQIRRWIKARGHAIERCLGRDTVEIAVVHPIIPLRLRVAPDGAVDAAAWTRDPSTERCIAEALNRWRFAGHPGPGPIDWSGEIDFGFGWPRAYALGPYAVRVEAATVPSSAPPTDAPPPIPRWTPEPDWVTRQRGATSPFRPSCVDAIDPDVTSARARVVVQWKAGAVQRVAVHGDPALTRCAVATAGHDRVDDPDAARITTRAIEFVRLADDGLPRVIPGRAITCCDGHHRIFHPRIARRQRAVEACYRARLAARPDLRGALFIGLHARDRTPLYTTRPTPGPIDVRAAVLDDRTGDPPLAACVAAALESITVPLSEMGGIEPRAGLRVQVEYAFEGVVAGDAKRAVPPLQAWLTTQGADLDRAALLDRADSLAQETRLAQEARATGAQPSPHMAAGRAAEAVGRFRWARAFFAEARDAAQAADDPARALDAQLARVELMRVDADDADEDALLHALARAVELDTARVAAGGAADDRAADRVDRAIVSAAVDHHRAMTRGGPDAEGSARRAARAYGLWQLRSDDGARRRPQGTVFTGDGQMLLYLADFAASRGELRRGVRLIERYLTLFPAGDLRQTALDERLSLARLVARADHGCAPAGAPDTSDRPARPCPPWLEAWIAGPAAEP